MRILLVEDNPGDVRLLEEYLAEANLPSVALTTATSLVSASKHLEAGGVDVILLDLGLPDSQGIYTVRRMRDLAPLVPIVVLTGAMDEELGVEAVREGAQDYLEKSAVNARLLGRTLRYALERSRAKTSLARQLGQGADGPYLSNLTLARVVESLSQTRSFVASFGAQAGFSPDRIFDMQVAVSEACANAIEHAKPGGALELTARLYRDRAEVDVNSPATFELPTPEYLEGAGQHRGMGLPLMAKLSDHLALYSRPDGGTQVTLTFYLHGMPLPPGLQPLLPPTLIELLQSQERLDAVFAHMSEGLIIGDGQAQILHVNPAAARVMGAGEGEVGQSGTDEAPGFRVHVSAGTLPGAEWPLSRVTRGETFGDLEVEIRKETGEVIMASYAGVPIRDEAGNIVLTVLTVSDITERKQTEQEREQLLACEQRLTEELSSANEELQTQYEELAVQGQELEAQNQELKVAQEETVRLLAEQSSLFRRLQETLLDIPQELPGVRFGHLYHSATQQAQVGGDFYDVFAAKHGQVAILVGDVSGHGVEAARIATLVKDTVHAFAHQFAAPHLVLRETNRLLVEKKMPGFVTAFLGLLDPATGRLVYSCAGHPPPLLTQDGRVSPLESIGPPLGAFADSRYRDSEALVSEGSLLLLYTDGITEARGGDGFFGEQNLIECMERFQSQPVDALPSLLLAETLLFSGGRLQDDAAMLAIRYVGKPGAGFPGA